MLRKKRIIPALLLAATPVFAATDAPVKGDYGNKLPESYLKFFPSASFANISDMSAAARKFNGIISTPHTAKRPQLKGMRPTAIKAPESSESTIYGYLYYFQGNDLERGIYRINPASGSTFLWSDVYTADWSMNMTGGWLRDGRLCGVNTMVFMGGVLAYGQIELDLQTGEVIDFFQLRNEGTDHSNTYLSMTYRDLDDRVYGFSYIPDGSAYSFNSAQATDIDTSEVVKEVDFADICVSLCYNMQEDLFYGVTTGGSFVSIDPKGTQTKLFDLKLNNFSSTVTGLVYSPKDGKYIWNAYFKDGTSGMYSIDPVAKTLTKLHDCPAGEEYIFMVCPDDNVLPGAPATPSAATYTFTDGSHDGTVVFSLPGKTAEGTPLSGNLEWRVLLDGTLISSGTGAAGSKITAQLKDIPEGNHTFSAFAGINGNFSMPAIHRCWIGTDYPVAPEGLELTETTLKWNAVTQSEHGGYVDYHSVKYAVYLNNDKIGETTDTHFDIQLPEGKPFTSYTAQVVAVADGKESEKGISNYITYGEPLEINPSIHYRPEEKEFELFTAIDLDGKTDEDGYTRNWHYSETMGFPSFASGADGEDLLIFPPIRFSTTDKAYRFRMEAGLIHDRDRSGTIEVLIGTEPKLESMKQVIMPAWKPQYMLADIVSEYFAVNEPGTYYIGILTKTNEVGIHISDIDISTTDRAADVPMAVSDLKAVAGENGALSATVTFTMPTLTVNGKQIAEDAEITATVISRQYVQDHMDQGEVTTTKTVKGKPGSKQTLEIETIQNLNTVGVRCSVGGHAGSEAVTRIYTGLVKPYIVQNLKAEVTEDNMGVMLSWTPPVEGEDPGPIGDSFFYTIWYYSDGWQHLENVGWDELEMLVELPQDSEQQILMIGVMALNAAGQSDHISSTSCVIGKPYTLPMTETFPDYMDTYTPIAQQRPTQEYNGTYWMVDDPSTVAALFANQSKVAYIGYIGQEGVTSAKSRITLPKFSTENTSDVKFTLTYWGGPYDAPFSLLANKYGLKTPESVGSFPSGSGWISNTLDIPAGFVNEKWVELLIDNTFPNNNSFALFSGYSISGVSGVEGLSSDGEGRIFTEGGMLHVAGFAGESLVVTDVQGRVIVTVPQLEDLAGFVLAPGVYVAKAGSVSRKVIVK